MYNIHAQDKPRFRIKRNKNYLHTYETAQQKMYIFEANENNERYLGVEIYRKGLLKGEHLEGEMASLNNKVLYSVRYNMDNEIKSLFYHDEDTHLNHLIKNFSHIKQKHQTHCIYDKDVLLKYECSSGDIWIHTFNYPCPYTAPRISDYLLPCTQLCPQLIPYVNPIRE